MQAIQRALLSVVLWSVVLGESSACRSRSRSNHASSDDSNVACASACAALVHGRSKPRALAEQSDCSASCRAQARTARTAGCAELERTFLACVSRGPVDCSAARRSAAACLEHGLGMPACRASFDRLSECLLPCALQGTVELSTRQDGAQASSIEVTHGGCTPCAEKPPDGAPTGSACSSYAVCQSVCCDCPNRGTHYRVRACLASHCAAPEEACRFVPKAARACR